METEQFDNGQHEADAGAQARRYRFIGQMVGLALAGALLVVGGYLGDTVTQTAGGSIVAAVIANMGWKSYAENKVQ